MQSVEDTKLNNICLQKLPNIVKQRTTILTNITTVELVFCHLRFCAVSPHFQWLYSWAAAGIPVPKLDDSWLEPQDVCWDRNQSSPRLGVGTVLANLGYLVTLSEITRKLTFFQSLRRQFLLCNLKRIFFLCCLMIWVNFKLGFMKCELVPGKCG